ncbi:putative alpha/Beta hydrolase [Helianthus annuus]|uniref:Alpha/Beta hydrolase n=1 Tax=Helianthus annuus TaxID=4232 RepID=A0A251V835_HELAN|nr:putative alpha/Beta hydrolase [Helianthus annuus]KAJ0593788.1 putative alpha/Beta hydrolase [Helianthus annuus]KAJ0608813.1 putative alpha/Beta hydrolase [Helianthus annuus]KAJ0774597.1 putative alpha/Beta hydrolase [Helianthus annuus]KAJ0936633.1 putative alpha/Beta hydrolase [Helianthus annuus]
MLIRGAFADGNVVLLFCMLRGLMMFTTWVLSIHGSADKIVPMKDAKEFAKHILDHKLCIINGADHEYSCHQNELASIVHGFVKNSSSHDSAPTANKSVRSCL